jgi:hypothetical protein
MNSFGLIAFLLVSTLLPGPALSNPSIQTKIISGGEVAIMEVEARYDCHGIAVASPIVPHSDLSVPAYCASFLISAP